MFYLIGRSTCLKDRLSKLSNLLITREQHPAPVRPKDIRDASAVLSVGPVAKSTLNLPLLEEYSGQCTHNEKKGHLGGSQG
jgi:hypothetical protein